MGIGADIIVRIATDASRAADDVDAAAGKFGKFQASMESMIAPATVAVGAIAAFGKAAIDSASATEQAMGAVDSVFGASGSAIKEWASTAATSVGLSESAYAQMASVTGASLQSMGLDQAAAADQTGKLITLGADLAATMGGTTAEAVDALGSALRGEADPAERLGLNLKASTVAARMAAEGTDKLTGSALDAAKASTIMQLATEQAAGANGQFARESDSAAGSAQIAAAQYEDAKAALGEGLLPVMAMVTEKLGEFAGWVKDNTGLVMTLVGVVGGLALAVLAVNAALALASAAQAVWTGIQMAGKAATAVATAAQWAWNAAISANPIGLIILAVAALIAGIVLLWQNSEAFRDFFIGMWEAVSAAAVAAWEWIKETAGAVWEWIVGAVESAAGGIQSAIESVTTWITDTFTTVRDFITGIWDAIKGAAETVWNGIKSVVESVIGGIRSAVQGVADWMNGIWEGIKSVAVGCWNAIKGALDALMAPFNAIKSAIQWLIDKLKMAWDWAVKVISKIPFVGSMLGASESGASSPVGYSAAAYTPASAGVAARLGGRSTAGGSPVSIVVQGALDPVAVAQQIESLLIRQGRRTRGVTIGVA